MPVHAGGHADGDAQPPAGRRKQKLRRGGDDHVVAPLHGGIPGLDSAKIAFPKGRNAAVHVGHGAQKAIEILFGPRLVPNAQKVQRKAPDDPGQETAEARLPAQAETEEVRRAVAVVYGFVEIKNVHIALHGGAGGQPLPPEYSSPERIPQARGGQSAFADAACPRRRKRQKTTLFGTGRM